MQACSWSPPKSVVAAQRIGCSAAGLGATVIEPRRRARSLVGIGLVLRCGGLGGHVVLASASLVVPERPADTQRVRVVHRFRTGPQRPRAVRFAGRGVEDGSLVEGVLWRVW